MEVCSYSTVLPAVVAIIRFKYAHASFYTLFALFWIGAVNEFLSEFAFIAWGSNAVNGNIYVLVEGIMLLFVFKAWGGLKSTLFNVASLSLLFVMIWLLENFYLSSITNVNSLYRCLYSMVIVFLSLDQVNFLIVSHRKSVLKDPVFLFCIAFIIFYTYKAGIEVFYVFSLEVSGVFLKNLFRIMQVVNLLCNIIFTIAILWIRKRQTFTLPY